MKRIMKAVYENRKELLKGLLGVAGTIAAAAIADMVFKDDEEPVIEPSPEQEPIDITDQVTKEE